MIENQTLPLFERDLRDTCIDLTVQVSSDAKIDDDHGFVSDFNRRSSSKDETGVNVHMSIHPSVHPSVRLFVRLCVHLPQA